MTGYRAAGAAAGLVALTLVAGLAWFVYGTPGSVFQDEPEHITSPPPGGAAVVVTVRQGQSPRSIGEMLEQHGVIRSARLFEVLVGMTGEQNALEAGEYEFEPGTPAIEAVRRIAQGRTASRDAVIPEGLRVEEVAGILDEAGVVTRQEFLNAAVKSQYSEPFLQNVGRENLEGYLFPARYSFARGASAHDVVDAMLRGFQVNVADKLPLQGEPMSTDQIVTLASIVEREAAAKEERPVIASVFLNRLRDGQALQADPTVQFALANDSASVAQFGYWKKELTLGDLQLDSPYNTYAFPGLPPGPIANPGFAAIQAVVQPATTNYLYFVARDDGTHVFAATLDEHLRNVQMYQR